MRRIVAAVALAGTLGLFGAGCSSPGGGLAAVTGPRAAAPELDVSGGVTPTFSWTGGAARTLSVKRVSDGALLWTVSALDRNAGFTGPVAYGVVPRGAEESSAAPALAVGTTYEASVERLDGTLDARQFTP